MDAEGRMPSAALLHLLRGGQWQNQQSDTYPDERQVRDYYKLLAVIEKLALYEDGLHPHEYNYLKDGMWEFVVGNIRLTFYDTPGDGTFTPKCGEPPPNHFFEANRQINLDEFDDVIRLGIHWEKVGQKADPQNIERALSFRKEDVAHDKEQ